jgi:hypothetical protein
MLAAGTWNLPMPFCDADCLTAVIHESMAGQCPLDEALMGYERRRNEATMGEYRDNIAAARIVNSVPFPGDFWKLWR